MKDKTSVVKTAAALLLVGWVFAFFTLPFAGVDLLIDAVGYILVFNGVRVLGRLAEKKSPAPALAIALTVVCAVELFVPDLAAQWLLTVRYLLETALCLALLPVLVEVPRQAGREKSVIFLRSALAVNAGGAVVCALLVALAALGLRQPPAAESILLAPRALLLVCTCVAYRILPGRAGAASNQ